MSALTLNLSDREAEVLTELSDAQEMSKAATLRQALRLYQYIDRKRKQGLELAFVDKSGNVVRQEIIGLGPLE